MKDSYPQISLMQLCRLFGVTRQALYQHLWSLQDSTLKQQLVLQEVRDIRKLHPAIGCRKLYCLLQPFLLDQQIKMGRDALFDLLAANKLLVRKRRRRINTTQSRHWLKKYPNLIKDWHPEKAGELWVADITYVPARNGFLYLSLITDACSHKIVGFYIATNLEAKHTAKALEMALNGCTINPIGLIHHSDRGVQYCSADYVKMLNDRKIRISMTENGDPLENPIAERVNGILKEEYLKYYPINNQPDAMILLKTIVHRYNQERPHQSLNMLTPEFVHSKGLRINKRWARKQIPNIAMETT